LRVETLSGALFEKFVLGSASTVHVFAFKSRL